jgi:hypothetical protein
MQTIVTRRSERGAALSTLQAAEERETLADYQIAFERHRDAVLRLARRIGAGHAGRASEWQLLEAEHASEAVRTIIGRLERIVAEVRAGTR